MRRIALLCLALISCTTNSPLPDSMQVEVRLTDGVKSKCLVLTATGNRERASMPVVLTGKTTVSIGIAREDEPDIATITAKGFSDEACTVATVPAEGVTPTPLSYGQAPKYTVFFEAIPQDLDHDTYTTVDDCNDGQPDVHPNALERCDNQTDDDCNGKTDCEEVQCGNMTCHADGGVCFNGRCIETMCSDARDDDGDSKADCADSDCDGHVCGTGGTCLDAGCIAATETGLCNDGLDNDGDAKIDCEDSDCPATSACTDNNACTSGETCSAALTCTGGTTMNCSTPPGACFASAGTCNPASGACEYPVNLANTCTDFDGCTTDSCLADGGCGSTPITCATPPMGCFASAGTCSNGACSYPIADAGVPCNDGSNCTINDACNGIDSTCTGARPFCAQLTECQRPAQTCSDAGACDTTPWLGGCDAGLCNSAGTCVPVFPFVPSNFTNTQLPPTSGALNLSCTSTIDTRTGDGGVGWSSPCGIASPTFTVINASGVESVLVLFDSVNVAQFVDLISTGTRPLIIAVSTNANINGRIIANSGEGIGCPTTGTGADGGASATIGSGGGGAGFRNTGTNGSNGIGANMGSAVRGAGGQASGTEQLVPLHGGCHGGNGGRSSATNGGLGGIGGGVVQLTVAQNINVTGRIIAPGKGGLGGHANTGAAGGGGGSGGAILLECTQFTLGGFAVVAANGGGGGEGAAGTTGNDGSNGTESGNRAFGGAFASCGGNGGEGGARMNAGSADAPDTNGICNGATGAGAGGGGSGGRVRINAVNGCTLAGNSAVSPAPSSAQSSCIN